MVDMLEALIVSNNPELSRIVGAMLGNCGLRSVLCPGVESAKAMLSEKSIRLIFCADCLADGSFRDLLDGTANSRFMPPVVVLRCTEEPQGYPEVLSSGVFDCFALPFRSRKLEGIVNRALGRNLSGHRKQSE
jgi:DNA-binding NtrC family response regulator